VFSKVLIFLAAQVVKILKELHEQNLIAGKAAGLTVLPSFAYFCSPRIGKSLVYHSLQDTDEDCGPDRLAIIDTEISALKAETETLKAEEKTLKTNLTALSATMTVDELEGALEVENVKYEELNKRLAPLRAGTVKPVDKKEKEQVEAAWKIWTKRSEGRKKIFQEVWGVVTEQMDRKQKQELSVGASRDGVADRNADWIKGTARFRGRRYVKVLGGRGDEWRLPSRLEAITSGHGAKRERRKSSEISPYSRRIKRSLTKAQSIICARIMARVTSM